MGQALASTFVWDRSASGNQDDDAGATACIPSGNDGVSIPMEIQKHGQQPERKTADAAGFDLCASEPVTLPAGSGWTKVKTGVKLGIGVPSVKQRLGAEVIVYGSIRGRSGLTSKGIEAFHGTIDADYSGEILVLLKNVTDTPFEISTGDRIAQLIFSVALVPTLVQVDILGECFQTERGEGGFGSTGMQEPAHTVVTVPQ